MISSSVRPPCSLRLRGEPNVPRCPAFIIRKLGTLTERPQIFRAEAHQIENAVEGAPVEAEVGDGLQFGFRVKGDAKPRGFEHEDVVGPVADRDGLFHAAAVGLGHVDQKLRFAFGVHDRSRDPPGEQAARYFQLIGEGEIEVEPLF